RTPLADGERDVGAEVADDEETSVGAERGGAVLLDPEVPGSLAGRIASAPRFNLLVAGTG
ncbi:MAG: hypothetical protein V3R53_07695, partial [Gammaproteobacteria bacterium]